MVYRLETFRELAKLVHFHYVRILSKSCQLKLFMILLQTNNGIVHVMTTKLSVGFNSDITRQIKKAFFQAHLHSLKHRTKNVHDQLGRSLI